MAKAKWEEALHGGNLENEARQKAEEFTTPEQWVEVRLSKDISIEEKSDLILVQSLIETRDKLIQTLGLLMPDYEQNEKLIELNKNALQGNMDKASELLNKWMNQ